MILLAFVIAILLWMAAEAVSLTVGAFIFLDLPFWDGWHAAWDRPGYLFLIALVAAIFSGSSD